MKTANRRYCSHCNAAFASDIDKCPRDGADLQSHEINPLLGQVFGKRYLLVERLGAGGMGEVYRAEHVTIGKSFAIKVLLGEVGADNSMVARFHREAKSLSLLSHRNVVSVADFGETNEGLLYLVTEFVDGSSLSYEMQNSEFDVERTIHVVRQIAKALAHAHRRGVVHRDLKPDNVMLVQTDDESDVVKVLDFGIATVTDVDVLSGDAATGQRLTSQGIVMGTPAYIAPEQAMAGHVDHRADLYSLGILLYELLEGHVPFSAKSAIELMSKHLQQAPPSIERTDVTGKFKAVTMRLLAKLPEDRYKDVDEFLAALDALEDATATATYDRRAKTAEQSAESKRLALRQGSDTLLAPAVTPDNLVGPPLADSIGSTPSTERPHRQGRNLVGIVLGSLVLALAAAALLLARGDGKEAKQPIVASADDSRDAAVAASVEAPTDASASTALEAPPAVAPPDDASVPADAVMPLSPISPSPAKIRGKAPPTMQALQASVERIGTRLNTLASTLEKGEIDKLRRKWLDLATALPDVDGSVESRRKYATRVNRLNRQIAKAARTK